MKKLWIVLGCVSIGLASFGMTGCQKEEPAATATPADKAVVQPTEAQPTVQPAEQKPKDHPAH